MRVEVLCTGTKAVEVVGSGDFVTTVGLVKEKGRNWARNEEIIKERLNN